MKPGHGHAIFTAECSHAFHFHCIASNVKHGRQSCPVCRAKWKEVPFQNPSSDKPHGGGDRINNVPWPQDDSLMRLVRRIPSPRADNNRNVSSLFHAVEPDVFDDDDEISVDLTTINRSPGKNADDGHSTSALEVETYPEVSAVMKSKSHENFSILIHLKAPPATAVQNFDASADSRTPVDLVTVLDVSGSMAGTKLALLKRAMGFVIQNLGPSDRLSVIAFSSTARRLFPLRKMTHAGKHEALQAVNSLSSNGGTNIADGLRKGAKVLSERKCRNPVNSVILLSDGQDTYTTGSDHQLLLPSSMRRHSAPGLHIPVHAFGFGADHDAVAMHTIAETSGGTFSFIETENVIQDAFAQCIGGILSVVVQELKVEVECIDANLQLTSLKSGSYKTVMASDKRKGIIEVGDLYAEEERDFLVTTDIPTTESSNEWMQLIKVKCVYKNPVSKNLTTVDSLNDVRIERPVSLGSVTVSMEVDKQKNRLHSAEAMAEARAAAERGDLAVGVAILGNCQKQLSETASARAGDLLCASLDAELREMQERMANRQVYESSGRAYMLSGLSSHSWQRATARGESTDSWSSATAYQTPSMVDMVHLSQSMVLGCPMPPLRGTRSSPASENLGS